MPEREQSLFDRVAAEMAVHLGDDATGHDVHHLWRVNRLGTRIAESESADPRVVGVAALVHDLHRVRGDGFTHPEETIPEIREILGDAAVPDGLHDPVCHCVAVHEEYGFEDDPMAAETVEAEVLQDADNLDAIGAVGVARAFQFGGAHGNLLWDPERPLPGSDDAYRKDGHDDGPASTYHHFHAKLLRLHENMNTETGKEIAAGATRSSRSSRNGSRPSGTGRHRLAALASALVQPAMRGRIGGARNRRPASRAPASTGPARLGYVIVRDGPGLLFEPSQRQPHDPRTSDTEPVERPVATSIRERAVRQNPSEAVHRGRTK